MEHFRATAASRMLATTRRTHSSTVADMFSRTMFMPASISLPIHSAESVAGPSVAIIFVFLIGRDGRKQPGKENGLFTASHQTKLDRVGSHSNITPA